MGVEPIWPVRETGDLNRKSNEASLSAPPAGFEPAIWCLTGTRALRAAPRGRQCKSFAQVWKAVFTFSSVFAGVTRRVATRSPSPGDEEFARWHGRPCLVTLGRP